MNGDGDILGTRRHLEVQPSNSASLGITSTVGGKNEPNPAAAGSGAKAGAGAIARSTTGHSSVLNSLKRQRSVGGMTAGIGKPGSGENENVLESAAGEVPVDKLTPGQMKRYQAWKRSRFERDSVREVILDRAAPTLTRNLEIGQGTGVLKETSVLAVSAMAKMYVGDLVEEAKLAQLKRGESGPLRPEDLLEARRKLAASGKGPPLLPSSRRAPGSGGTGGIGETANRGKRRRLGGGSTFVKGSAI